jgi:DNA invertase Pin-like site-specific DNA recombinase
MFDPFQLNGLWFPKDMTETPSPSRLVGYARVSTYGQTLDAQLEQLRAAGCGAVYREKVSGARADRRELVRMLRQVRAGDVVVVTRIDRLARSTFDLFAIVKQIADAGAQFRSLAEPWADTGTSTGRLMLAVLGGLADVERDLIRTRTAEGRSRAKANGQHMGRPPALTPQQQAEARQRRAEGATLKVLARSYNVGIATIARATAKPQLTNPPREL